MSVLLFKREEHNLAFIAGVDIALPMAAAAILREGMAEAELEISVAREGSFEEYLANNRLAGYQIKLTKLHFMLGSTLILRSN